MNQFLGFNIIESPYITAIPKIQLSKDFTACSGEFKQSMNEWLRDTFGTYMPAYVSSKNIFMHPDSVIKLKMEVGKEKYLKLKDDITIPT